MQGKFFFSGHGVKIPGTDIGLSVAGFKLWLAPTGRPFKGYTAASNQGLLGLSMVETSIVEFVMMDLESEEPFFDLHTAVVDVTITSTLFAVDGGIATIKLIKRTNDPFPRELTFTSDACKGVSATGGDIHFVATLVQLNANENDPHSFQLTP